MIWTYRLLLVSWGTAFVVALAGVSATAAALAHCYVPSVDLMATPLCGPGLWGAAWVPAVVAAAEAAVVGWVLVSTVLAFRRQVVGAQEVTHALEVRPVPVPDRLAIAARAAGAADITACVSHPAPMALTVGSRSPRIVITETLVSLLDDQELEAVLRHEAVHATKRHPARYAAARAMAYSNFVLPALRCQGQRVVLAAEIDADRAAAEGVGLRPLVSALAKLQEVAAPGPEVAIGSVTGLIDARIRRMAGLPHEKPRSSTNVRALTALGAALLAAPLIAVAAMVLRTRGIL